jgi:hypothetical protein
MTTKFTWLIDSMPAYPQAEGQTDVVFQVNWQCNAQDVFGANGIEIPSQFQASTFGAVPVTYVAGAPYTPYDQLTQEQVWGWVNPQIDRPAIEINLQALIDAQKNPTVVTPPLPWSI